MSSTSAFAGLFGRSPIRSLQEHMHNVVEYSQHVLPFI